MTVTERTGARSLPVLFAVTLLLAAALLFVLEPLLGRLVLPLLGGTPAVWNTCMVFFQAMLLAGYAYAHAAPARLGPRRHVVVHLGVLLLPWLVLPVTLPAQWPAPGSAAPWLWLLGLLLAAAGLPFFAVAASGPLLQRWFTATGHPEGKDPYFLYVASNLGSMLGLFLYPLVFEPTWSLAEQGRLWAAGYTLFILLTAACAVAVRGAPAPEPAAAPETPPPPLSWARCGRWLLLAFVPSSLMLSVTTYLTTDVAAVPFLWVLPLALYLLTFVLAFARRPLVSSRRLARGLPLLALVAMLALLSEATEPEWLLLALHLVVLFGVGLFCHGALAEDRPHAGRLTEFYLWLAAGGVLGGLFNALLAPLLFSSALEYPLVLILACALRPPVNVEKAEQGRNAILGDLALPAALGLLTAGLVLGAQAAGLPPGPPSLALMFAAPLVVCYTFLARPLRFALGLAALLAAGTLYQGVYGTTEYRARNFFGIHRVTVDPTGSFRVLVHGNTVHGRQSLDPSRRREPLTYYSRTGPIGRVFALLNGQGRLHRVGVVGLGSGTLCCYAQAGQEWTYYEIDPAVVSIARDSGLFTYWKDSPVAPSLVLGDARQQLARSSERYDLLVIDAFSSDAIPLHLLTSEAIELYRQHLAEGGVLAFHITNRYLELEPVLGDLAAAARPPLACLARSDRNLHDSERRAGKASSHWVVFTEQETTLAPLQDVDPWHPVPARPGRRVWSDDFANLLGVLRWRDPD
jgi:hypothetical protein